MRVHKAWTWTTVPVVAAAARARAPRHSLRTDRIGHRRCDARTQLAPMSEQLQRAVPACSPASLSRSDRASAVPAGLNGRRRSVLSNASAAWGQEAAVKRGGDGGRAVVDAQFRVHVEQVCLTVASLMNNCLAAAQGQAVLSPAVATRLMGQMRQPASEPLSQRELEVLELIARGSTNREAAKQLFISRRGCRPARARSTAAASARPTAGGTGCRACR
jgi:ATP/maltotriose-dependent transcriptional regulator MalT